MAIEVAKPPELTVSAEQQKKIDEMIESSRKKDVVLWDSKITKEIYVPVDGGEIRVVHVKPEKPLNKRTIVFVPGWGGMQEGFNELYEVLHDEIEFYWIDTREKRTSRIKRRKVDLTIQRFAIDIMQAIDYLKIDKENFTIIGSCWSSTIILQGILDYNFEAKSILLFDPMHKLWFNRFILTFEPIVPAFVVNILRPVFMFFAFLGMKEKKQKERSQRFVKNAVVWKWKKAAYQVRDLELFGTLNAIKQEIIVFNETTDKVHNQEDYPKMAKEMPNGRFFFMNTVESNREQIMSAIIKEFAKTDLKTNIPPVLREFEKNLKRT
jgi:hypothetical protein